MFTLPMNVAPVSEAELDRFRVGDLLYWTGKAFHKAYYRDNRPENIHMAVASCRLSVSFLLDGYPKNWAFFEYLGLCLQTRFKRFGNLADIEDAIVAHEYAEKISKDATVHKITILCNLGNALRTRFLWYGELKDIDRAIIEHHRCVDLVRDRHTTPSGTPIRPLYLSNLGISLQTRFEKTEHLIDIDNAVTFAQRAVKQTPDMHADKPVRLSNLGASLRSRFKKLGSLIDISGAIHAYRHAIRLTSDRHPDMSMYLNDLGICLQARFGQLQELSDIDEAIALQRDAVKLTPDSHSRLAKHLTDLGGALENRFTWLRQLTDFENALQMYLAAASQELGPPSDRLYAAKKCAQLCWQHRNLTTSDQLLDAYRIALAIIPQLVWLGYNVGRRYEQISSLGDIASAAAAVAIAEGQFTMALEWLETGRSIVWNQLFQLRTPLDELRIRLPHLANRLQRVSQVLEVVDDNRTDHIPIDSDTGSYDIPRDSQLYEESSVSRRKLAEEYKNILADIRKQQGFEHFLISKTLADLAPAPESGHVIVINVHESRCDALVLCPSKRVIHVPLPKLSRDTAVAIRTSVTKSLQGRNARFAECERGVLRGRIDDGMETALAALWTCVVQPVLANGSLKDEVSTTARSICKPCVMSLMIA
jgi:tetratricopeptide (TPR) repeat protein